METKLQSKLQEARFFLELMDSLEVNRQPLLERFHMDDQFAFLLSAFLEACYSVTEYLKHDARETIAAFRSKHSDFYGSGPSGGWRTRAVHFAPVVPGHKGYIPPPGNNVVFRLREKSYTPPTGNMINFTVSTEGAYYFTDKTPQNTICDQCAAHLIELTSLVESLEKR